MRPRLVACDFVAKQERDGQYDRLARVLAYTASVHCRDWDVQVETITPELLAPCTGNPSHAWNTAKLDYWVEAIQAAPDGADVLLMDADTMILRRLDPLWAQPFDLAYTVRSRRESRLPLNGGVVAVRVSDRTRAAMAKWGEINRQMMGDPKLHGPWHRKYMGMNQASFGYLLEEGGFAGLDVRALQCQEWNCCEWHGYTAETRVVHVKSRLRRAVFGAPSSSDAPQIAQLVALWRELERRALLAEAQTA